MAISTVTVSDEHHLGGLMSCRFSSGFFSLPLHTDFSALHSDFLQSLDIVIRAVKMYVLITIIHL